MKIKGIRKTLRTIGDVRALILGLPKHFQDAHTWRLVTAELLSAANTGDATGATIALEIVLMLKWCARTPTAVQKK